MQCVCLVSHSSHLVNSLLVQERNEIPEDVAAFGSNQLCALTNSELRFHLHCSSRSICKCDFAYLRFCSDPIHVRIVAIVIPDVLESILPQVCQCRERLAVGRNILPWILRSVRPVSKVLEFWVLSHVTYLAFVLASISSHWVLRSTFVTEDVVVSCIEHCFGHVVMLVV